MAIEAQKLLTVEMFHRLMDDAKRGDPLSKVFAIDPARMPGRDVAVACTAGVIERMTRLAQADASDAALAMSYTLNEPHMRTVFGLPVMTADLPKERVFDWSGCRSPARARRRYAQGHPQRVKITEHDVVYLIDRAAFRMGRELDRRTVRAMFDAQGGP